MVRMSMRHADLIQVVRAIGCASKEEPAVPLAP